MSNINWGQFFNNNLPNGIGGINTNGTANTNLNPIPMPTPMPMPQPQQQTPLNVLMPNYFAQLGKTTKELAELDKQQTVKMLKELLNMPKNFDKLMEQLTTPNSNIQPQAQQAIKTALMMLASQLNLSQLSNLLQNSSKQAMTNLYQMLAQYNQIGVSIKDEQLGQISKLISFISASSTSDVQSLKSAMLMYLPWLPLTDPEAFKLEIGKKGADEGIGDGDSITVLIATENYGNIQVYIIKTEEDGIKIQTTTSQTFPQKDFVALMKEESKKYGININFDIKSKEAFNKEKVQKSNTQVYMNTSPGVNPFLLLISNSVIKNVHLIDTKENINAIRKERMDNDKGKN